jgi:small subunit ribosomal protein S2
MEKLGEFALLPKKEVLQLNKEREKLQLNLGGIKDMHSLPGVLFIIDTKKEHIAIAEARTLNIPIVGLVDTNGDPDETTVCIPGNDDAIRAIKLISSAMADAVIEAREGLQVKPQNAEIKDEEINLSEVLNNDETFNPESAQ